MTREFWGAAAGTLGFSSSVSHFPFSPVYLTLDLGSFNVLARILNPLLPPLIFSFLFFLPQVSPSRVFANKDRRIRAFETNFWNRQRCDRPYTAAGRRLVLCFISGLDPGIFGIGSRTSGSPKPSCTVSPALHYRWLMRTSSSFFINASSLSGSLEKKMIEVVRFMTTS